jgi:3-methyladenine DNA glycosylase AlkD
LRYKANGIRHKVYPRMGTFYKVKEVQKQLKQLANPAHAAVSQRFFKTGPGEYGEGDVFIGIRVPVLRKLAGEYKDISVSECKLLLQSPVHEERLLAILILIRIFKKSQADVKKSIYELYLNSTDFINNWDLVDTSAEHIVGAYLTDRSKRPLYRLARSNNLWKRRIAIMATFRFVKGHEFAETIKISEMLMGDRHDLIHKATGWMLREIGKRDLKVAEAFLKAHYKKMPRTMLRYAIERFPENKRQRYLKGTM